MIRFMEDKLGDLLVRYREAAGSVLLDRQRELDLALCCLLAGGNLLIEDVPGVGKTTLVKILAKLMGLEFKRIQFTNDLMPSDILGGRIFDGREFEFIRGPIFAQLVLGDELNRASPRTQSAVLQAMDEHAVTIDGVTTGLPSPFFFVGTQNPGDHAGTSPLPESQLDRFLMRLRLGIPERATQRKLLSRARRAGGLPTPEDLLPVATAPDVLKWQATCPEIHLSADVESYLLDLVESCGRLAAPLSPRATLGLQRAGQCWAMLNGRSHVRPDDLQAVFPAVLSHRVELNGQAAGSQIMEDILRQVPPP